MRAFKWSFWAVILAIVAGFLYYTLPSHDVVRITEVYNRVTTIGWENKYFYASPDAGTAESALSRDIRFISAVYPSGKVIVYRNEDTGWIWPPYFKYDSSNLQAVASNLKSTDAAPKWVMVTHYGWRLAWLSIYPNALRITEVPGPDYSYFPWINVVVLALLAFGLFMARRIWLQFVERVIDPAMARTQNRWDRVRAWFGRKG